jgi:D-alanyl-D-alanine carboxypeptidase
MQSEGCASRPRRTGLLAGMATLLALLAGIPPARAEVGFPHPSYMVVDAATGHVITAYEPDAMRYPASLTKLMTLYLAFEALRDRRITLASRIPISVHAASVEPVKLGLSPGSSITVHEAILSMVTMSANDAATALGEYLGGGSEARFAQMMTLRAHALGMAHTTFRNASGLPAPDQVTTARDIAILARRLIADFPDEYHWFSTRRFLFRNRWIVSDDNLLRAFPGADGMKTGYTHAAGHNLVTSAQHGDVRLIGVVLGAQTIPQIDGEMMALLNQGFAEENAPAAGSEVASADGSSGESPSGSLSGSSRGLAGGLAGGLIATADASPLPSPPRASEPKLDWALQVAAYASRHMAEYVAGLTMRILGTGRPLVEQAALNGRTVWRARVTDLSAAEARSACPTLAQHKLPCWLLPPSTNGELASR